MEIAVRIIRLAVWVAAELSFSWVCRRSGHIKSCTQRGISWREMLWDFGTRVAATWVHTMINLSQPDLLHFKHTRTFSLLR